MSMLIAPPQESQERLQFLHSPLQSLLHWSHRKELDQRILDSTKDYFRETYHIPKGKEFDRLWKDLAAPQWTPSQELTQEKIEAIKGRFDKIFYNGPGFFHEQEASGLEVDDQAVENLIQALCHGRSLTSGIINRRFLNSIFIDVDPSLLKSFRDGLQRELVRLSERPPQNDQEAIVWSAFRANVIALLPYSYPDPKTEIRIPVLDKDRKVRMVVYEMTDIPLTLTPIASPMRPLGMIPRSDKDALPILSYMGTTFPGGDGFITSILADTTPGYQVGGYIYKHNKAAIGAWFEGKEGVEVTGISLGGALALQTAADYSDKISRVDAFNPPGLERDAWHASTGNTLINIYCQAGDIISKVGHWFYSKNVNLFRVFAHQEGVWEDPFTSHIRLATGCRRVTFIKENPEEINRKVERGYFTFIHRYISPWAVFVPTFMALVIFEALRNTVRAVKTVFSRIFG